MQGGARRLARPECASLLSEYRDTFGRSLAENAKGLGVSASEYVGLVYFDNHGRRRVPVGEERRPGLHLAREQGSCSSVRSSRPGVSSRAGGGRDRGHPRSAPYAGAGREPTLQPGHNGQRLLSLRRPLETLLPRGISLKTAAAGSRVNHDLKTALRQSKPKGSARQGLAGLAGRSSLADTAGSGRPPRWRNDGPGRRALLVIAVAATVAAARGRQPCRRCACIVSPPAGVLVEAAVRGGARRSPPARNARASSPEFQDAAGRTLAANASRLGRSARASTSSSSTSSTPPTRRGACRRPNVLAFTSPGSRVVFVCPQLAQAYRMARGWTPRSRSSTKCLPYAGVGRGTHPSSREITASVYFRCGDH